MDNFAAFILTHGRPDRVITYDTLKKQGYTGRIVIVIDNEDDQAEAYRERFGDQVYQFDKRAIAEKMDQADNFDDRRSIVFARNASFEIAAELGIDYFVQLDDDYHEFRYRRNYRDELWVTDSRYRKIKNLDRVFEILRDFYHNTPIQSVAMAQGGDFIGGFTGKPEFKRKCMNSFVCSPGRSFRFQGRINEDVNTYTQLQSTGPVFLTIMGLSLEQGTTQKNAGGMTELYLDSGTYVKSFYTVIFQPSSVVVAVLADRNKNPRLHHKVNFTKTAPRILNPKWKKDTVNGR